MIGINPLQEQFGNHQETFSRDRAKNLVKKALNAVAKESELEVAKKLRIDIENSKVRHEHCRAINGEVVVLLMNKFKVPGMVMTQYVDKGSDDTFKNKSWGFHAVGVLLLEGEPGADNALYAAFDETNKTENDEYFLRIGNLETLSHELDTTFGGDWKLDFIPPDEPHNSVVAKLQNAVSITEQGKNVSYDDHILHMPLGLDDKKTQKPLGLKYVHPPMGSSNISAKLRQRLTFGYA